MLMLGRKPVSPLCMPYAGIEKATNCLLEVPQNIKCEINGSILTLKSESTLVLGNGSTYTTLTTTSDLTRNIPSVSQKQRHIVWYKNGVLDSLDITYATSGSSAPTSFLAGVYALWLNPDDRTIKFTRDGGTTWNTNQSYPITIIDIDVGGVASFAKDDNGNDIIFNDFSIIGHHYIGYPNNNLALGCDGFNTDGSYKTTYIHRNALYIFELPKAYVSYILHPNGTLFGGGYNPNSQLPYEEVNELPTTYVASNIYVKDENQIYRWSNAGSEYQIQNSSIYYGYINLSSNGIFRNMAIQQPLTKYKWVVKLIP